MNTPTTRRNIGLLSILGSCAWILFLLSLPPQDRISDLLVSPMSIAALGIFCILIYSWASGSTVDRLGKLFIIIMSILTAYWVLCFLVYLLSDRMCSVGVVAGGVTLPCASFKEYVDASLQGALWFAGFAFGVLPLTGVLFLFGLLGILLPKSSHNKSPVDD